MDPATLFLHKDRILGSTKLVAVYFCAHLRTHSSTDKLYIDAAVSSPSAPVLPSLTAAFGAVYQTFKFRFLPYSMLAVRALYYIYRNQNYKHNSNFIPKTVANLIEPKAWPL